MSFVYSASGLTLTSPVELPPVAGLMNVLPTQDVKPAKADVFIDFCDLDTSLQGEVFTLYDLELQGARCLLTIPQIVRFLVQDGSTISIHIPDTPVSQRVSEVLVERVMPLVHLQRASFCLQGRLFNCQAKTGLLLGRPRTGLDLLANGLKELGCAVSDDPFVVVDGTAKPLDHVFLCHPQFPFTSEPDLTNTSSFKALVDIRAFVLESEAIALLGLEKPLMESLGRCLSSCKVHDLTYSLSADMVSSAIGQLMI